MIKIFLLTLTSFVILFPLSCRGKNSDGDYSKVVSFSKDAPVSFPDFELTYTGERKQTTTFPNGNSFTFTYYDFKIKNDKEERTISWSAGTGEIAPAYFEINGVKFMLELRYWEKEKKKLDGDELVITKL